MCGIAGLIGNGRINLDRGTVAKMLSEIEHRGPDALGIWSSDSAVLGGARFSIVDLNAGPQPILNESKSLVLVCNGEIFNNLELREDLLSGIRRAYR